jgi:hypothetical protein
MIGSFTLIMKTKIFVLFTTLLLSLQCFANLGYIERLRNLQGNSAAGIDAMIDEYLNNECNYQQSSSPLIILNQELINIIKDMLCLLNNYKQKCPLGYPETTDCNSRKNEIINKLETILSYKNLMICKIAQKIEHDKL